MKTKLLKQVGYVGAIGTSVFLLFFVITCTWIGYDVKQQCFDARKQYGGDCVEALTDLLKDENRSFRDRNSAIWALGQLGDGRAAEVLEGFYTGKIPDKEPLDGTISQYELKKALKLTRGGTNLTAVFWRNSISH